jgi:hypothetical protein
VVLVFIFRVESKKRTRHSVLFNKKILKTVELFRFSKYGQLFFIKVNFYSKTIFEILEKSMSSQSL